MTAVEGDLDTLLYVRESILGIQHVGGIVNALGLIDSIIAVRAELRGEAPDIGNDRQVDTLNDTELEFFAAFHEWYRQYRDVVR